MNINNMHNHKICRLISHAAALLLLVFIFILMTSCSKSVETTQPAASDNTPPAGYSIAVSAGSGIVTYLTIDKLDKLEKTAVRAADRNNDGPSLSSVLNLAGIKEYKSVKVVGMDRGRMASAELKLERQQVTDQTILDITNRGTCKFVSPDVAFDNWIYDVTALEVEE
jgi:hypothetical protein